MDIRKKIKPVNEYFETIFGGHQSCVDPADVWYKLVLINSSFSSSTGPSFHLSNFVTSKLLPKWALIWSDYLLSPPWPTLLTHTLQMADAGQGPEQAITPHLMN